MKYALIIPDGGADEPLSELGGKTPFEAAETPNIDALAKIGRVGRCVTTPPGFIAGSDVCSMTLCGYDAREYHTGRAPLEAAALGLDPGASDWIFRMNFVTIENGRMKDHSAGALDEDEALQLVEAIRDAWAHVDPELASGIELTPGVSYRNIVVDSSGASYEELETQPPHEIPNASIQEKGPKGPGSDRVLRLMSIAAEALGKHPVNAKRISEGKNPANGVWIWGQGTRPQTPDFQERFGVRGAMITAVDLLAGIAKYIGWDRLDVPGLSSFHDNDYKAQGEATIAALDEYDLVCSHVESPDECSHQGDWKTKVAAIESIDREIVGPTVEKLRTFGDAESDRNAEGWRLLILPDHYTLCSTRVHANTPSPILMAGAWIRSLVERPYTEAAANESDLVIDPGADLMEYFLKGGLADKR